MDQVVEATDEDLARMFGGVVIHGEWYGLCARRGRLVTAMGGVLRKEDAFYAFLEVPAYMRGRYVYRHAFRFLQSLKERGVQSVRASCDETIPRAKEFMERLGFTETDEQLDGRTVWEWQP